MNLKKAIYTVGIKLDKSPDEVFTHLIDLKKWWPEDFEGEELRPDSEFIFTIGDTHYSRNKAIEWVPGKKLVWLTLESRRKDDNYDWTGTKMIFELIQKDSNTQIKFTYDGVVLKNEVDRLAQICNMVIKENLYNLLANLD